MSTISSILPTPPNGFSTQISTSSVSSSDLSIELDSTSGLGTEGVGQLLKKDADGNLVAGSVEFVHWTNVSGNTITFSDTGDRGITGSDSGAQSYVADDYFEVWVSSYYTPSGIREQINDTNKNELVKFSATASAVNEITVTNAATGNAPEISATGGDTNIGITLTPKGTGALTVGGNTFRHGAWASWAVSWTNVSIGNAAVSARYAQIGKTIIGHLSFALGSTTSISGNVTFSLPVAGTNDAFASSVFIGTCYAEDNGSAGYTAFIRQVSTTTASPVLATTGAFFAATAPFTWAENDYFRCSFMYEAA